MKRSLLVLAATAAAVFGPAVSASAAGFSYAYVGPPVVGTPGEYDATLRAVASVDGTFTITVTALEGTTVDGADDCALTVTGLGCVIDATAGVPVTVDLGGTYTGSVIHLRTTATDAAGPVTFAADTRYAAIPAGGFPIPPMPTPPPVPTPPVFTPPVFTPPTPPTPPVFTPPTPPTPPVFTPPTPPVLNPVPTPTLPLEASPVAWTSPPRTLDDQRVRVLKFVNRKRAEAGDKPVALVDDLNLSAQRYAARLAGDNQFTHTDGSQLTARIAATGYKFRFVGENLGLGQTSPWQIVHDWMHSPEHRANMLDTRFSEAGIGVATRADGQIVWVLHLGQPA